MPEPGRPEVTPQARQFVADLESVQAEGWAELALLYARALSALRVVWASRRRLQARIADLERRYAQDSSFIVAMSRELDVHHALLTERTPVGYITAYRNADDEWSIEFDGEPFATPEQARADLVDAAMSGLPCRTLTLYDEEI